MYGDSWSSVIGEVLVCELLNEMVLNSEVGAWIRENGEIKSTAKISMYTVTKPPRHPSPNIGKYIIIFCWSKHNVM